MTHKLPNNSNYQYLSIFINKLQPGDDLGTYTFLVTRVFRRGLNLTQAEPRCVRVPLMSFGGVARVGGHQPWINLSGPRVPEVYDECNNAPKRITYQKCFC